MEEGFSAASLAWRRIALSEFPALGGEGKVEIEWGVVSVSAPNALLLF